MVTVPDAAALHLTSGMTLEAWVRPTTTAGSWRSAILKETTGGLAYSLYAANDQARPAGYVHVGSDIASTASSTTGLNVWTHLAVTFDGSTERLYVNGTLAGPRVAKSGISGDFLESVAHRGQHCLGRAFRRADR